MKNEEMKLVEISSYEPLFYWPVTERSFLVGRGMQVADSYSFVDESNAHQIVQD